MTQAMAPWARGLVVTCEHATNRIPEDLCAAFTAGTEVLGAPASAVLASHRGYDAGAHELAQQLSQRAGCMPHHGEVSRLVIDLNRSLGHPKLYSQVTRALSSHERRALYERYWLPHRQAVQADVRRQVEANLRCVHLAMHSFTPVLGAQERRVDVGLLYDPSRPRERHLADKLAEATKQALPDLRVRRNQPYRGTADGVATQLRRKFTDAEYAGLEIEVNQALVHNRRRWGAVVVSLVTAWQHALAQDVACTDSF